MTGIDLMSSYAIESVVDWMLAAEPEWPTIVMLSGCALLMSAIAYIMTHDAQALAPPTIVALLVGLCAAHASIPIPVFCSSSIVRLVICDLSSVAILYSASLVLLDALRSRFAWAAARDRVQVWICALSCWIALACAFGAHETRHNAAAASIGLLSVLLFAGAFGVVPTKDAHTNM